MRIVLTILLLIQTPVLLAEDYASIQARRADLFHQETGFRISHQRGPTPDNIPLPSKIITTFETQQLMAQGAVPIDVFGALQSRYDDLDGTWLVRGPRASLPNATWLPETGRGALENTVQRYFEDNLSQLTTDKSTPLIFFCVSDCWMSWNATQRAADLGYTQTYWFKDGTDGWSENGLTLVGVLPVPVHTD